MERGVLRLAETIAMEAVALTTDDLRRLLSGALSDANEDGESDYGGPWLSYVIPFDQSSGEIVYCDGGDYYRVAYEVTGDAATRGVTLHMAGKQEVIPRTVFDLASETETLERSIPKGELDNAKDSDFAGKGRSYPILKPEDVMAAVRSIGRAGPGNYSSDQLKKNIIRIAKRKGFTKELPQSWQESRREESEKPLSEAIIFCGEQPLLEAAGKTTYKIKVIAPGQGSSAFYPKEVLQEQGPKIFAAGTHMYWNHPTAAEEAERPEGDLSNLAGVLTSNAYYDEKGPKGPGLYADAKVFPEYAEAVQTKGPHIGVSIRAYGHSDKSGKLEKFTRAESVDFVTKPGAGGAVLTEAARQGSQEEDMDEAKVQELINKTVTPLHETITKQEGVISGLRKENAEQKARIQIAGLLEAERLPAGAKVRVVDAVLSNLPLNEAGELDAAKLGEAVKAAVKVEADYITSITGGAKIRGFGPSVSESADLTEDEYTEQMKKLAMREGMSEKAAAAFVAGRQ